MRASGSDVLFLERYTGTGATREQFIKTFATASIKVVFRERGLIEHRGDAAIAGS
jgi:hypothetical protein